MGTSSKQRNKSDKKSPPKATRNQKNNSTDILNSSNIQRYSNSCYGRLGQNSSKFGAVAIAWSDDNQEYAHQFAVDEKTITALNERKKNLSQQAFLKNIRKCQINSSQSGKDKVVYLAETEQGSPMISTRTYTLADVSVNGSSTQLLVMFSPNICDSNREVPKENYCPNSPNITSIKKLIFSPDLKPSSTEDSKSHELQIDSKKFFLQEEIAQFMPQNTVMHAKATDQASRNVETAIKKLTASAAKRYQRGLTERLELQNKKYVYAFEWLHIIARSLAVKGFNPQVKINLAAAPAWCNTLMIIPERVARCLSEYIAKNELNDYSVIVRAKFSLLAEHIAQKIIYAVTFQNSDRKLTLYLEIDTFGEPVVAKATDFIQLINIISSYDAKKTPLLRSSIDTSGMSLNSTSKTLIQSKPITPTYSFKLNSLVLVFSKTLINTTGVLIEWHDTIYVLTQDMSELTNDDIMLCNMRQEICLAKKNFYKDPDYSFALYEAQQEDFFYGHSAINLSNQCAIVDADSFVCYLMHEMLSCELSPLSVKDLLSKTTKKVQSTRSSSKLQEESFFSLDNAETLECSSCELSTREYALGLNEFIQSVSDDDSYKNFPVFSKNGVFSGIYFPKTHNRKAFTVTRNQIFSSLTQNKENELQERGPSSNLFK